LAEAVATGWWRRFGLSDLASTRQQLFAGTSSPSSPNPEGQTAPTFFLEDTPTAVLVRQVLGAIAQFEKAGLVAKLAAARKRKRVANGKCEGRKSLAETNPEAVALARALSRKRPKGGQMSLRAVSAAMAAQGYLNERERPFNVAAMLAA
jgi:hypothetical protein